MPRKSLANTSKEDVGGTAAPPRLPPRPAAAFTWTYAPLPRWELYIYMAYMVWLFISQFVWVYGASQEQAERVPRFDPVFFDQTETDMPLFGRRTKDTSNWEWRHYVPFIVAFVPYMFAHNIAFALCDRFVSDAIAAVIMTAFSAVVIAVAFTPRVLIMTVAQGTIIYTATHFAK